MDWVVSFFIRNSFHFEPQFGIKYCLDKYNCIFCCYIRIWNWCLKIWVDYRLCFADRYFSCSWRRINGDIDKILGLKWNFKRIESIKLNETSSKKLIIHIKKSRNQKLTSPCMVDRIKELCALILYPPISFINF